MKSTYEHELTSTQRMNLIRRAVSFFVALVLTSVLVIFFVVLMLP